MSGLLPIGYVAGDDGILGIAGTKIYPKFTNMYPGRIFYLNPSHTNADDDNDGQDPNYPLATLAQAYANCTANQNDTVIYVAGSTSLTLTAALTWAKSYTHLIGVCAPVNVGQRARIFQLSTLTGASPLLTISASGCIFKDFYIFQGVADATSLVNVSVTGERNYFENVHFAGGGHATQAINGGASLSLAGSENTFVDCTIGVDTIAAATGMMGIIFPAGAQASRNIFKGCRVTMYAGHTAAGFVEVMDGTAIDRYTLFENCQFINSNKDNFTMAAAFVIPAFAANNSSCILLKDCMSHGVTTNDANDRGVLYGNMNAYTGADLSGVAVELVT